MTHSFDRDYWEQHWQDPSQDKAEGDAPPANPYVERLAAVLPPGTALDAGCGAGAEALALAGRGWEVVAVDVSASALAAAARRGGSRQLLGSVSWTEADLVSWDPGRRFDLVTTNYAHPAMPQLAFYTRVAEWVAPGGTLLVVGHGHGDGHGHGHDDEAATGHEGHPPAETMVTAQDITALLAPEDWDIITAEERPRTLNAPDGSPVTLRDVVVHAIRRR